VKVLYLTLALAQAAMAGSNDPAQVAVDFLDKVRSGKLNLEPGGDTALTANTDETKRREIARRLERNASDLGNGSLEAGEAKLDNNLAAVLVRKLGGFDPSRFRVFAVALVKRGEAWLPAPVLASFDNTGVGYAPGLRQRLDALESWMLEQQVIELGAIQQQATERMRMEISTALPAEELRQLGPEDVGLRFLDACSKQQLPLMLGLLGGLQTLLPDDWNQRLQAADAAAAEPQTVKRPWRLLMAPDILRTLIHQKSDPQTASLSIACLDPTGAPGNPTQPQLELVEFGLSKSADGLWQVDLPPPFLAETSRPDPDPFDDERLLGLYPSSLRKDHPLQPQPAARAATQALEQALGAPTLQPMIGLLDLAGDKKTARLGCARAAGAWGALHDPTCVRHPLPLGFFETAAVAGASFQYFSVREPDRMDVRVFFFEKVASGWHLLAGLKPSDSAEGNLLAAKTWADGETKRWSETWRKRGLASSTHLATLAMGNAPPEEAARNLVAAWLRATRAGNVAEALSLTAWLDPEKSPARVLRNLGYEINGARKAKSAAAIIAVSRGETWAAVAVRTYHGDKSSYPIYPVVATPKGPKILIEVDLFANAERGREFLNSTSISHLRNYASPEATDELRDLFKQQAEASGKQSPDIPRPERRN
jgi:hypothetical protein